MSESIGIIAGSGQFPRLVAEDAKAAGYGVVVCAFHGFTDPGLEALADAPIVRDVAAPRAGVIARMDTTLLGYAAQEPETGRYRLTLKMFELSSGIVDSMDIMGVAKAHLERLSQRTGEAVHLVIRDGRDIVYIYKTESGPMRMSSRVGLRSPLYCTGVGKAILATLPGDELEDIWTHSNVQKLTDKTITDLEELRSQLVEVRANGYAIDDEENELGVRCVAVAIPGADGRAESAFSISGLAPYMTPERIRRIATLALDARTDILADLGLR